LKIAITADLHLTKPESHPERYSALKDICHRISEMGAVHLILAGDTLDQGANALGALEALLSDFPDLTFHMLPGNHDYQLHSSMGTLANLRIYDEPATVQFVPDGPFFLLLPYSPNKSMGEAIAPFSSSLPGPWYLISHGDWTGSLKMGNPLEPGVYMPLTQADLVSFRPALAFLGHIHQPVSSGQVHYPGSPIGLDISETGRRSFIVLDTDNDSIARIPVNTDILYFDETLISVPLENEEAVFRRRVQDMIASWKLNEQEKSKAVIRLSVRGYTRSRTQIHGLLMEELADCSFYKDEGPDLIELYPASNPELAFIAQKTTRLIHDLDWTDNHPDLPGKDEILFDALASIYRQ